MSARLRTTPSPAMGDASPKAATDSYALAAAIAALAMWSGTAIANKVAVAYMSGLTAGILRSLLASAIALPIALWFRLPRPVPAADRLLLVGSGLASFAGWPALMSIGIVHTTASHAAIVMATIPIMTVLVAQTIERRLPRPAWWLGAAAAFGATVVLVTGRSSAAQMESGGSVAGDLIILAGGFVCALGYVAGGKLARKIGTAATTLWGLAAALPLQLIIFGSIAADTAWTTVPARGWIAIGWMTVLSSLAGYGLWFYALGKGNVSKIGTLQLGMPAVTIAAAAVFLGEPITMSLAAIAAVIVAGTWWAQRRAA